MSTILEALRKLQRDREQSEAPGDLRGSVTREARSSPRRHRLSWLLAGGLGVLLAGVLGLYLVRHRGEGPGEAAPPPAAAPPAAAPARPSTARSAAPPGPASSRAEQRTSPRVPRRVVRRLPPPARPAGPRETSREEERALERGEALAPKVKLPREPPPRFGKISRAEVKAPPTPAEPPAAEPKPARRVGRRAQGSATAGEPPPPAGGAPSRTARPRKDDPGAPSTSRGSTRTAKAPAPPPAPTSGAPERKPPPARPAPPPSSQVNPFLQPFEPLTQVHPLGRKEAREGGAGGAGIAAGELAASSGFPDLFLEMVRWHPDPVRRRATLTIDRISDFEVHEGDIVQGVLVEKIDPGAVDLRLGTARKRLHVGP